MRKSTRSSFRRTWILLSLGGVSSEGDQRKIKKIRRRTRLLVPLGDCAETANVAAKRSRFLVQAVYDRAYRENVTLAPEAHGDTHLRSVPELLGARAIRSAQPQALSSSIRSKRKLAVKWSRIARGHETAPAGQGSRATVTGSASWSLRDAVFPRR